MRNFLIIDPCKSFLCNKISNAEHGFCQLLDDGEYACKCVRNYTWASSIKKCVEGAHSSILAMYYRIISNNKTFCSLSSCWMCFIV